MGQPTQTRTFTSRVGELRAMSDWAREVCINAGLAAEKVSDLEVCLNEVVANIAFHGYEGRTDCPISITLIVSGNCMSVTVEDSGKPFDPRRVSHRGVPLSLEDLTIGGYGMQIIRSLVQNLQYRRESEKNVLTFRIAG